MKQIGNYTYNQKFCIGQGAFGKVFQGTSTSGKKVAIKKIDKQVIESDTYLQSSIQFEIQILKKFNHPHIVHLEDMVLTTNNIYIITQFCNNGDLKQYLRNKKPTEQQGLSILYQILRGFIEIVKLDVVHRDLKPANILINDNTFKICDFGFAKYLKEMGKMNKTSVGTPMYMSPQVLKGKPYTNKTDIWSLGILTFEMLFGRTPWQGNSEELLYKNIISKPLQTPHCSNFTYDLLKGMLQVQQSNRWDWNKIFQYTNLSSTPVLQQNIIHNPPIQPPKQLQKQIKQQTPSLKSLSNPRFCYFALNQFYLNPLNTFSFKQFRSMLFSYTISQYLQYKNNTQLGRIMMQQLEQLQRLPIEPCSDTSIQQIRQIGLHIIEGEQIPSTTKQIIKLLIS